MTAYCLMRLVPHHHATRGQYRAPKFPSNVGYRLLADSDRGDWGIYEYDDYAPGDWSPDATLSDRLVSLVASAMHFPPALAIARDDVSSQFRKRVPTPTELVEVYEKALEHRLSQQRELRFVFRRAISAQTSLMIPGAWYWVLAASMSGAAVRWVSDDYHVYSDLSADFELSDADIAELQSTRIELGYSDEFPAAGATHITFGFAAARGSDPAAHRTCVERRG